MIKFKLLNMQYLIIATLSLFMVVGCGEDKKTPTTSLVVPTNNSQINFSWAGDLNIIDSSMYKRFLQDHNVCDYPGYIWTFGTWNCDNYNALYIGVHLNKLEAPTSGMAEILSVYNNNWLRLPPSTINGTFAPIDQNSGIEIYQRGYDGTASYNALFRYRIYGDITTENQLTMEIYYRNVKFGTATIQPRN